MKKKILKVILASFVLSTTLSGVAFAASWVEDNAKWKYQYDNGMFATARFISSGAADYYMGEDGYMLSSKLLNIGSDYFYLNEDGVLVKNDWKYIADDENNMSWYYFGDNGKAYRNRGEKLSLKDIGDEKYAFTSDGKMLTGFVDEYGEQVGVKSNAYGIFEAKYFFTEDGKLYRNKWLEVSSMFEPDRRSELGMKDYSNYEQMWMYFDENGKIVKSKNLSKAKVMAVNEKDYVFDENGVMIPGFSRLSAINPLVNTASSSNILRISEDSYDGSLVKNRWTWAVPTDVISEDAIDTMEENNLLEYSWWYSNEDGKLLKDGIYTVKGRKYAFDKYGRMQAGFVIMFKNKFGIKYDVNEWSKADFLEAPNSEMAIPAIDRGDLYVFNSDEINDGSLLEDGEYSITLNDEVVVFGVYPSGKVYGNRNKLQRVNGKYYYNGVRLDANDGNAYGIIDINVGAETEYVVVDQQGLIVRGNRVLKDNQGYWIVVRNGRFVARLDDVDAPKMRNGRYYRYDKSLRGLARYTSPVVFSLDNIGEDDFVVFEH